MTITISKCNNETKGKDKEKCASEHDIDDFYDGMNIYTTWLYEDINFMENIGKRPVDVKHTYQSGNFIEKGKFKNVLQHLRTNHVETLDSLLSFGIFGKKEYTFTDLGHKTEEQMYQRHHYYKDTLF